MVIINLLSLLQFIRKWNQVDTSDTSGYSEANKIQAIPFRGVGEIQHSGLLLTGDDHDAYVPTSGVRTFLGNIG